MSIITPAGANVCKRCLRRIGPRRWLCRSCQNVSAFPVSGKSSHAIAVSIGLITNSADFCVPISDQEKESHLPKSQPGNQSANRDINWKQIIHGGLDTRSRGQIVRWLLRRTLFWAVFPCMALMIFFSAVYCLIRLQEFKRQEINYRANLYGAPFFLTLHLKYSDIVQRLSRLRYRESKTLPSGPGQFRRKGNTLEVYLRSWLGGAQKGTARLVRLTTENGRIAKISCNDCNRNALALEPELIGNLSRRPAEQYQFDQLKDLPQHVKNAFIAIEDHRFYSHYGIDPLGVLRAIVRNLVKRGLTEGGSTITQQLIKNRLLTREKAWSRKLKEVLLALFVFERVYSKDEILESYLNTINFGLTKNNWTIRGIGAAANCFFSKDVRQLNHAESALLAGIIKSPNNYISDAKRLRERRNVVLNRMHELKLVSGTDYSLATRQSVHINLTCMPRTENSSYVNLIPREDNSHSNNLQITTTIDARIQQIGENLIKSGLKALEQSYPRLKRSDPNKRLQGSLIALDPRNGSVLAMVSGRDYRRSQLNRVLHARRQAGSTIKPLIFASALTSISGAPILTPASIVVDAPISIQVDGKLWEPRNYRDKYEGPVTIRTALAMSLNSAAVRVGLKVSLPVVNLTLHQFGIEGAQKKHPATLIGSIDVTPIQLALAYSVFANGGLRIKSPAITLPNSPMDKRHEEPQRIMSSAESYLMTSLMQSVIDLGSGTAARELGLTGDFAGKTGTSNEGRDAWFVGYSANLLTVVWVGFDSGEPHGLTGAEAALPIWAEFMREVSQLRPGGRFAVPTGIVSAAIDAKTGKRSEHQCPATGHEIFLENFVPEPCIAINRPKQNDHWLEWLRQFISRAT